MCPTQTPITAGHRHWPTSGTPHPGLHPAIGRSSSSLSSGPRGLHAISRQSSWAGSAAGRPTASERAGDHADGQRAELAGDGGDKWCGARAGAAALTGGHEKPGRPARGPPRSPCDASRRPSGRPSGSPGPVATGEIAADIEPDVRLGHQQGLGIGVHRKGGDLLLSTGLDASAPESRCAG